MSSVRKRVLPSGETRWQVDYKDQEDKRRSKQFQTKREAEAYETKVRGEIAAGTHVADSSSITVEKAGEFWLQRCRAEGLETSTIRQYDQHLRHHILPLIMDFSSFGAEACRPPRYAKRIRKRPPLGVAFFVFRRFVF